MADRGRKSLEKQIQEETTPDYQKTTGEKMKEKMTDTVDRMKAKYTPDRKKSEAQREADIARGQRRHEGVDNFGPAGSMGPTSSSTIGAGGGGMMGSGPTHGTPYGGTAAAPMGLGSSTAGTTAHGLTGHGGPMSATTGTSHLSHNPAHQRHHNGDPSLTGRSGF